MNQKIVHNILRSYERKRDKALYEQRHRQNEVYQRVPRIKELDDEISKTGILMSKAVLLTPDRYEERLEEIRLQMEELKREKAILMTENNIPLEYMDINYECTKCKDTGFLEDSSKCSCFKQELINIAYKMSNLERLLHRENFQTFDISIFSNEPYEDEKLTPRENMMNILNRAEGFVINFDYDNGENLLFYGSTGLGKTFMCNCIAKSLLDKGKIVIYQTAFKILEIIEEYRFGRNSLREISDSDYNLLFEADLLIIDDLGTELTNSFTNTEIFNIVNSRLINGKKTIISTNLKPMEMFNTYTQRTFSRILNEFIPLKFYGKDLRWEV